MTQLAPVQTDFFAFSGGLDLTSPPMQVGAGALLDCLNYEPDMNGGYSRMLGYERFDGRPRPSEAIYFTLACTFTTVPAQYDMLTIGGVSAKFIRPLPGGALVVDASGIIPASTAIMRAGVQVGTTASAVGLGYATTARLDAELEVEAADARRAVIGAVPGSGPVRGVWMHRGQVYAVRDNAAATASVIHKATAAGWQAIPLPFELGFTAGALAVNPGDTVKGATSNATGIVRRVCVEAGAWGAAGAAAAAGRLIIDTVAGVFQAGELIKSSADAYAATRATTVAPLGTQVTLSPGGAYKFINANFSGQQEQERIYGVNGVDRAFEFDGATLSPIRTGAVGDKPTALAAHNNSLWLALGSSAMFSVPGQPFNWQGAMFAGEIAFGDRITELLSLQGQMLAVYMRNSTAGVQGTGYSSYQRQVIAPETGAVPGTVAALSDPYMLDDRGITSLYATQAYGNFEHATASRRVQPMIDSMRGRAVAALPVRQRNLYRLYCSDGRVLVMYVEGSERNGARRAFTVCKVPFTPTAGCSLEDSGGIERVLIGASDGRVYEMDRGSTFDGGEIEAYVKLAYHSSRSPTQRKRYRRMTMEVNAKRYSAVRVYADFSFGDLGSGTYSFAAFDLGATEVIGGGGVWDVTNWDEMFWDSQLITAPTLPLTGSGTNVSLLFYSKTKADYGHKLNGVTLHYSTRRLQR